MTIFVDPTEARSGTRLPEAVYASAVTLEGLEAYTGADLLISCIAEPTIRELTLTKPNLIAFNKHLSNGVLVQRKSGGDLLGSINHLAEILHRMLEHKALLPPMLLYTGKFEVSNHYTVIVNGRASEFDQSSLGAALDYWDYRGGKVKHVSKDEYIPRVIEREILPQLRKFSEQSSAMAHRPRVQTLYMIPEQVEWLIQSRIGIGEAKAQALMDYCGSLANIFAYLSNPDSIKSHKIADIGIGTVTAFRKLCQLPDDIFIGIFSRIKEDEYEQPEYPQVASKHRNGRR